VSKTLSVALAAHYAGNATTLARLWKITRTDGEVFAFTDHNSAITYLTVVYEPSSVFDASAIDTSADLNVDNLELEGLLNSAGITNEDLERGRWDGAAVEIIEVNFKDLTMGHNWLRVGVLGEIRRNGEKYTAELRGLMHKLQNNIGRVVKPACDARLGDARCSVDIEALRQTGDVTSVDDNRNFIISLADANFTGGVITWTSGLNDGLSMEIKSIDSDVTVELQLPMPYDVQIGDDFTIVPGCDKTKTTCKDVYDNVINFRGFSFVPGTDKIMKIGSQ
jgi:uncharacterized phage protein (TIGR02218 family)